MRTKTSASASGINPTYVGIGRLEVGPAHARVNQPHVCGDRKNVTVREYAEAESTPRVWG